MVVGVVILLGNSKTGSHLRPISLDIPVALFPIAGKPIVEHQIDDAAEMKKVSHVFLLGGFGRRLPIIEDLVHRMSIVHKHIKFIYLEQDVNKVCGSAGVLLQFSDQIKSSNIKHLFIVNCDVVYQYNFSKMYTHYLKSVDCCSISHDNGCKNKLKHCIAVSTVPDEYTHYFGVIVLSREQANLVVHYVEKPSTFISNTINCGVFLCDVSIFDSIQNLYDERTKIVKSSANTLDLFRSVLPLVVAENQCFSFDIGGSFVRIKGAGSALFANQLLLKGSAQPDLYLSFLAQERHYNEQNGKPLYIAVSPTAKIDPLAKIGPNVSIGNNCVIDSGVRISNAILLDGCIIEKNSLIKNAIIGKNNVIEPWSRIEGSQITTLYDALALSNRESVFTERGMLQPTPAILGNEVRIKTTTALYNTIVMPYKEISGNHCYEIIL